MKRILILFLAVICAVSLLAGCGDKSGSGEGNNPINDKALEDGKDYAKDQIDQNIENKEDAEKAKDVIDSLNTDWPADKLPDGMPVYPDGEMFSFDADGNITVQINGTSEKSFDDYRAKLSEAGWELEKNSDMPGWFEISKDGWNGVIMFMNDGVTITIKQDEIPE